jgi:O-antigen ligase
MDVLGRDVNHPITHRPRVRPRPQILVGLLLVASAFPFRFSLGSSLGSFSVFDIMVVISVVPYALVLARYGRLPSGPRPMLWLVVGLTLLQVVSLSWTRSLESTLTQIASSVEAVVVFLVVRGFLRDAPAGQIFSWLARWAYLLLIPAALLWLRVPGFLPPPELKETSADYISYFVRLSHPFLGRSNNLATLLVLLVIPLFVWAWQQRSRRAGVAGLVALCALGLTFSRGVTAAFVASIVVYFVVDSRVARKMMTKIVVGAGAVVLASIAVVLFNDESRQYLPDRLSTTNLTLRSELFDTALREISDSPLIGIGGGVGEAVHNSYLQQFVYFGVIGGTLAMVLFVRAATCWFINEPSGPARQMRRAVGVAVVALLLTLLSESSYEGTLLKPIIWCGFGLLSAAVSSLEIATLLDGACGAGQSVMKGRH